MNSNIYSSEQYTKFKGTFDKAVKDFRPSICKVSTFFHA